ncbi:hypothetical protein EDC14_100596 [Hydrogenispora ethanolica]|uniref:Uncharacterized protein n=1 Tax=Hydrogenispora ethanolica TaxID=1082276 RepID=A0A4R1S2V0_HYDET|nr:hypothetical protein [Hydrogenispora ethanolica]TCL73234.1 hypothetical protein EDC14_100596 [Hydrogenispora ethanolica]
MKKMYLLTLALAAALLLPGGASAARQSLGEIRPGAYPLVPITNHLPWGYKDIQAYQNSLQKVELVSGGLEGFKDLPQLGMKGPYTGLISLGDAGQKFGVIIDIVGEEKRLYIDRDGDGSFAGESWKPLLNEWYGLQVYGVYGPEPIQLQVTYRNGQTRPIQIQVNGLLNQPSAMVKEKPYLLVGVETWFLARLVEDGAAKLAAVVDRNHNGCYHDPEDLLFIDYNDDGGFDVAEAKPRKRGVTLPGKQRLKADWTAYPDSLEIGGKSK